MNEEKQISRKKVLILVICVGIVAFIGGYFFLDETDIVDTISQENCNVLAFSIKGYLSTYIPKQPVDQEVDVSSSEDIVDGILSAQSDPDIKAVMLLIDSHGGDVGGIGVTASYLDESNKNTKEGYTFIELSSAKYKDTGDPNKPLMQEERNILLSDVRKAHKVFVEDVATNRGLELKAVDSLANGLTYIGEDALRSGLIDEIGNITTATKYLEDQIGEEVEICWY